jgi:hypothetical protein
MCKGCETDHLRGKQEAVQQIIQASAKIDSSIEIKPDIYMAQTVPAVELRSAIEADETIPADQKEYAFTKQSFDRWQNLQKVIFEDRAALLAKETEARMWQVNIQNAAGKLRADLRKEFQILDVNYQPTAITKKQKTTKAVKTTKVSYNKKELYDAAKKYDVPAALIQSIMIGNAGISYEEAAKRLHAQIHPQVAETK